MGNSTQGGPPGGGAGIARWKRATGGSTSRISTSRITKVSSAKDGRATGIASSGAVPRRVGVQTQLRPVPLRRSYVVVHDDAARCESAITSRTSSAFATAGRAVEGSRRRRSRPFDQTPCWSARVTMSTRGRRAPVLFGECRPARGEPPKAEQVVSRIQRETGASGSRPPRHGRRSRRPPRPSGASESRSGHPSVGPELRRNRRAHHRPAGGRRAPAGAEGFGRPERLFEPRQPRGYRRGSGWPQATASAFPGRCRSAFPGAPRARSRAAARPARRGESAQKVDPAPRRHSRSAREVTLSRLQSLQTARRTGDRPGARGSHAPAPRGARPSRGALPAEPCGEPAPDLGGGESRPSPPFLAACAR
jgi:hypothetical protein